MWLVRCGVRQEMWLSGEDQRNVFRMKQKVLERKEKKNNYSHGNGPRCVI